MKRIVFAAAVALVAAYVVDFASVRVRMRHATATDPYETLTAPRVYAIAEKGNKTEYQIDADNPVQKVTCVHALFPHGGFSPCWQVKRTLHQTIPM
ncbi:MAG TPA: hypothetical protein VKF79_02075 [Candidatus Acidoferrum sp.]|nr:hypothetical protein [Candidatus Acidoferrum sp.]